MRILIGLIICAGAWAQSSSTNATRLQGRALSPTAPSSNQVICWNVGNNQWQPCSLGGGGVVSWGGITGTLSNQTDLQNALNLKANLASPTFSGTPSLPTGTTGTTQSQGNNSTRLATTAYVDTGLSGKVNSTSGSAIQKASSGNLTAATSSDVVGLFSGGSGCTGTNLLAADGTCRSASGSGTVTVVGGGSLTSTALVTGGGTTTIQTAATTATMDSSGNITTPGSVTTGSGSGAAGTLELGQGTAPSAGTTSVKIYAPASVTSYIRKLGGAAATGIYRGDNSAGVVTDSQSELSGDVTTSGSNVTTIANLAVTNAKIAAGTIDLTTKVTGVLPAANNLPRNFGCAFGTPGGSALSTGQVCYIVVPYACTITGYDLLADTGTFTAKFWKIATGTAIPTSSNSISTSGVALSSGTALHSTTTSDFTTTTVSANDIVAATNTATASSGWISASFRCQ